MRLPSGHSAGSVANGDPSPPLQDDSAVLETNSITTFDKAEIHKLVRLLEVPFDPNVIEWRVTNTSKANGRLRGQVIPYADQRAYTDRLNALFSPAGWTRKYSVYTSPNFQRDRDQKTTAKVFVTCDLTIFGIGSHSATGEEWAHDENAGTAAEAQAFKRAASCFGLGRYLYYFTRVWVDLDDRKRPVLAREDYGEAKPSPESYLLALHRLGVKAENCVAVEDSERGLAAARAAGLRCLVIPNDLTRNSSFHGATRILSGAAAVLDMLGVL